MDVSVPLTNGKMTRGAAGLDTEAQEFICQRIYTVKDRHLIAEKQKVPFLLRPRTLELRAYKKEVYNNNSTCQQ